MTVLSAQAKVGSVDDTPRRIDRPVASATANIPDFGAGRSGKNHRLPPEAVAL